jgi:hypothetical protein
MAPRLAMAMATEPHSTIMQLRLTATLPQRMWCRLQFMRRRQFTRHRESITPRQLLSLPHLWLQHRCTTTHLVIGTALAIGAVMDMDGAKGPAF